MTFPEDSEVQTFEYNCFSDARIKKLRIPPSVQYLRDCWCFDCLELNEIEVSPNNPHFIYYKDKFLLGKSNEKDDKFDALYFSQFDIEEAVIPSQISVIKSCSFYNHKKLKSVKFSPNTE